MLPPSSEPRGPLPVPPTSASGEVRRPVAGGLLPTILVVVGIAVGALLLLAVLAYLVLALGVGGVLVASVIALVPLVIVLLAVRWIDRWEPEPRSALWFAFLWGAGVSVAAALVLDVAVQLASHAAGLSLQDEVASAVVQAPIVEEVGKGLGVLLVLWAGRRWFDGPVDGLVYAGVVAAGFAFTENILYFGSAFVEQGAGGLLPVFIIRGLFSPFAHVIFTSCTGLALGLASRRTGPLGSLGWFTLGLIPAVLLHALWNGALLVVTDVIGYYVLVQVPIFAAWIALVVGFRVQERRITRARLGEYAAVGWFTVDEVDLVATHGGRRAGLAWARAQPEARRKVEAMRDFVRHATRLAHTRHRIAIGRGGIGSSPDERALLDAISADRRALLG